MCWLCLCGVKGTPPLVSIPIGGPFESIGMNFVELDKSTNGNCYALVFQDYPNKWPEVYTVNNRRTNSGWVFARFDLATSGPTKNYTI